MGVAEKLLDQLLRLIRRERLEHQHLGIGLATPRRTLIQQLGPRQAEQEKGGIAGPAHEMLDQVEQGRLSPVDVLDDERERPLLRTPLECLSH